MSSKVTIGNALNDDDNHDSDNKQLLDEGFLITGIIKVEVSVISRAKGRDRDRDLDYLGFHKNPI